MIKKTSIQNTKSIFLFDKLTSSEDVLIGQTAAQLAALGRAKKEYKIPEGFVITNAIWNTMLGTKQLRATIKKTLRNFDPANTSQLKTVSKTIRKAIDSIPFTEETVKEISRVLKSIQKNKKTAFAVRSSALGYSRLPDSGLHETILNVTSEKEIIKAIRICISSLYSEKAILYREVQGIDHLDVGMAVLVQRLLSVDVSGVIVTDPIDGSMNMDASYGYYQAKPGAIEIDKYSLYKKGILEGKDAVISKRLGSKKQTIIRGTRKGLTSAVTTKRKQNTFALKDKDAAKIARIACSIESTLGAPQRIKWIKEIKTGDIYILHTKSVQSVSDELHVLESYILKKKGTELFSGVGIGDKIATGKVRKVETIKKRSSFKKGEILVASSIDFSWRSLITKAGAIVVEDPGSDQYAAVTAKELGIPCIVGVSGIVNAIKTGTIVTIDCSGAEKGIVYKGALPFEVKKTKLTQLSKTRTKVLLNISNAYNAPTLSKLPTDGVGSIEQDSIIKDVVKIHPLAAINYKKLKQKKVRNKIAELTKGYKNPTEYTVTKLAEGIARVASAFYPHNVTLKFSDDISEDVLGAPAYKSKKSTPLGASKYYSRTYKPAFKLECLALKKAREEWGLTNISVMIPYCATPDSAERVLKTMKSHGLERGKHDLRVVVACDIPSNLILAESYATMFDGLSIGMYTPQDEVVDEKNPVISQMIKEVISIAHKHKKNVSISDVDSKKNPDFMQSLVKFGIDTISTDADAVIPLRKNISYIENTVGSHGHKTSGKLLSAVIGCAMLAAGFMSVGAGCSNIVGTAESVDIDAYEVTPAEIRAQITTQVQEQSKADRLNERTHMKVSSFANVEFDYPTGWNVEHFTNGVSVTSPDNKDVFASVFVQIIDHPITYKETAVANTPARIAEMGEMVIVELDLNNGKKLEINVHSQYSKEFLDSVMLSSKDTFINPLLNHWDIREKRICAPMTTFARPNKEGGECTVYNNPCSVPDGYHVCSAE